MVREADRRAFTATLESLGFRVVVDSGVRQELIGPHRGHDLTIILRPGFPFLKPSVVPDASVRGARHQETNGALCLYPDNNADSWMPDMTPRDLLDQVERWFDEFEKAGEPAAITLEPLDAHLYYEGMRELFVFGDDFVVPTDAILGSFGLWSGSAEYLIASGITAYPNPLSISTVIQSQFGIASSMALQGVWVAVTNELPIAKNLDELIAHIGAAGGPPSADILTALKGRTGAKPKAAVSIPIAVCNVADAGGATWLVLHASCGPDWQRNLATVQLKAYEPAPAGRSAMSARVGANPLTGTRIAIFGLGALGSTISLGAARQGAASLKLIDQDRVRPTNVARHEALLSQTGEKKVVAIKWRIAQAAPLCAVETIGSFLWDPAELRSALSQVDAFVSATGSPAFDLLLNTIAVELRLPGLYVAAYNSAGVGRSTLVRPGQDPCLQCIVDLKLDDNYPLIPAGAQPRIREVGCNAFASVASPVSLSAIAIDASDCLASTLSDRTFNLSDVVNQDYPDVRYSGSPRIIRETHAPKVGCPTCQGAQATLPTATAPPPSLRAPGNR